MIKKHTIGYSASFGLAIQGALFICAVVVILWVFITPALGQNLQQIVAPSASWQAFAMSADGNKLVAASGSGASFGAIYTSTNFGNTWVSNNVPALRFWGSVASSADGSVLGAAVNATAGGGPIYISTNSGVNWQLQTLPNLTWSSLAISADGSEIKALSQEYSSSSIFSSTNCGATWTSNSLPVDGLPSIATSSDGSKIILGASLILISTNSGTTWMTNILLGKSGSCHVASSADGNKLVVATQLIYTSTNFGSTWITNDAPNATWTDVASSADGTRLIALASTYPPWADSHGIIYTSTNSGTTWVSNNVPLSYWISAGLSADGNNAVVVAGNGGGVWVSHTIAAPTLNLKPTGDSMKLSWLIPSTNYVLQKSSDLISWMSVTDTPTFYLTNLNNVLTISPSNSNGFYRLATP